MSLSFFFFFPFPTSKTSVGKSFKKTYVDCLSLFLISYFLNSHPHSCPILQDQAGSKSFYYTYLEIEWQVVDFFPFKIPFSRTYITAGRVPRKLKNGNIFIVEI